MSKIIMDNIFYKEFMENSPAGMYRADADGRLVWVNKAGSNMLGYENPNELIGELLVEVLYKNPKDREEFINKIKESDGVLDKYILKLKKEDDSIIYVQVSVRKISDAKNSDPILEGVFVDVTEQVLLDELRQDFGIGYFDVDKDDKISKCDQKFAEILEYDKPEDLIGMPTDEIHASEENKSEFYEELAEASKRGEPLASYRLQVLTRDGNEKAIIISSHFKSDDNDIEREGMIRDTTKLADLERERETLNSLIHKFLTPIQAIYTTSSQLNFDISRVTDITSDYYSLIRRAVDATKTYCDSTIELIDTLYESHSELRDNEAKELLSYINATLELANSIGEYESDMSTAILQLRVRYIVLVEKYNLLIAIVRKRDRVLYNNNHTMLLSNKHESHKLLLIYVSIHSAYLKSEAARARTDAANIRSVFLNKFETGFDFRAENLVDILNDIINTVQPIANQKGIVITKSKVKSCIVELAKRRLEIALLNLFDNAIKYSFFKNPENHVGRIRTEIELYNVDYIIILIINYGVGITVEELDNENDSNIFIDGVRGKHTYDFNRAGTGLGLPEANEIIERHGGYIEITSEPVGPKKEGQQERDMPYITTVYVFLPRKQKNKAE